MPKYTLSNTKESYLAAWDGMIITPDRLSIAQHQADKIISFKNKYLPLEQATGVPWYFIGLLHMRESNFDFDTHLHNGDPLNVNGMFKRTVHEPIGRPIAKPINGTSYTFNESAVDALVYEFGSVKNWDIASMAFFLEKYNGFGYRMKGVASPYLWAGSNQYIKGKYVRDKVFDPSVVDSQLGSMVVLKCTLDKIDPIAVPVLEAESRITKPPLSPSADIEKPKSSELRKTSRKFWLTEWAQHFFGWTTGVTAAGTTLNATQISATKTYIDTIKSFGADYGIFILVAALVLGFIATQYLKNWMKQDVADGRSIPSGETQ